jgi:hypothetical protein
VALPAVERDGLTSATLDGLLSLGLPLVAGLLVGRLVDGSRARAARLAAVLAIQRGLDGAGALDDKLLSVAGELRVALGARRLALLVGPDVRTAQIASVPSVRSSCGLGGLPPASGSGERLDLRAIPECGPTSRRA